MASNASRGAAAKARTKKWLERAGYQVAHLERVQMLFPPGRRPFPIKRDQFGSDLLAVGTKRILFVQVKSGESCRGGTFPEARRVFADFLWPPGVQRVIIAWPPLARKPRIVLVGADGSFVGEL